MQNKSFIIKVIFAALVVSSFLLFTTCDYLFPTEPNRKEEPIGVTFMIEGTVHDVRDGHPVAGALVLVVHRASVFDGLGGLASAFTNGVGRYSLTFTTTCLLSREFIIFPVADGYRPVPGSRSIGCGEATACFIEGQQCPTVHRSIGLSLEKDDDAADPKSM